MSARRPPFGAAHHPHGMAGAVGPYDHFDPDALLVALTLSPATYSRNRFFEMYRSPEMQRTRRRAGQLRGVVAAFASGSGESTGRVQSIEPTGDGGSVLVYEVVSLGLRRTIRLRSLEMSLLRYCVGRARGEHTPAELAPGSADRDLIGAALQRLSPFAHEIRASSE